MLVQCLRPALLVHVCAGHVSPATVEGQLASFRSEELKELLQVLTCHPSGSVLDGAITPAPVMSNRVYDEATLLQVVALANAAAQFQQQSSDAQMEMPDLFPALSAISQAGLLDLVQRSSSQASSQSSVDNES